MSRLRTGLLFALCMSIVAGLPAAAADNLSDLLPNLFRTEDPTSGDSGFGVALGRASHDANVFFGTDPSQVQAFGLTQQINSALATELSSLPLGSGAAAFATAFDPTTGAPTRVTESFGPLFAERALTLGKGKINVGTIFNSRSFDTVDGLDLEGGDIALNLFHAGAGPDTAPSPGSPLSSDLVQSRLDIDLSIDTLLVYANYGVTDRFDVGIALPFVSTDLSATVEHTIMPLGTQPSLDAGWGGTAANPAPSVQHTFDDDPDDGISKNPTQRISASDDATGIGDVILRGKYNFLQGQGGGLAVGLDLQLATGDEEELLGSGATRTRLFLAASAQVSKISPHANLGYTVSSGESDLIKDLPNEINFAAGLDAAITPKVTVAFDVIGRTLLDAEYVEAGQLQWTTVQHDNNGVSGLVAVSSKNELFDDALPQQEFGEFIDQVEIREADRTAVSGALGLKVNIARGILLAANILVPLNDDVGLQSDLTGSLGIEFGF